MKPLDPLHLSSFVREVLPPLKWMASKLNGRNLKTITASSVTIHHFLSYRGASVLWMEAMDSVKVNSNSYIFSWDNLGRFMVKPPPTDKIVTESAPATTPAEESIWAQNLHTELCRWADESKLLKFMYRNTAKRNSAERQHRLCETMRWTKSRPTRIQNPQSEVEVVRFL